MDFPPSEEYEDDEPSDDDEPFDDPEPAIITGVDEQDTHNNEPHNSTASPPGLLMEDNTTTPYDEIPGVNIKIPGVDRNTAGVDGGTP
jgi:hypothetical protein